MALIVEDGSNVSGAESYGTVAACDTYHSNRDNSLWTGTDAVKEAALRKATTYLDAHYKSRWKGRRANTAQALMWPRQDVVDIDGYTIQSTTIPTALQHAVYELALRSLSETLGADISRSNVKTRSKVGPIEDEWAASAPIGTKYPLIDGLLAGLIGTGMSLERA